MGMLNVNAAQFFRKQSQRPIRPWLHLAPPFTNVRPSARLPTPPFATLITRRGSTSSEGCRTTLTSTSINLHTQVPSRVRARYVAMLMSRNATVYVDASAVFRDNGAPRVRNASSAT